MYSLPEYDCHCHILPGLDDGAESTEEALYLAGRLVAYGFKRAVCTAHSSQKFQNTPATVIPACEQLQAELDKAGIPLQLSPSLEYRLLPLTWPEIRRNGWLLPWEGNHLLIELPIRDKTRLGDIDPCAEIRKLVQEGYLPVLAHPERYIWATGADYQNWHDCGAAFQRSVGSVEGFYGGPVAMRARILESFGFYSFIGTDLHNRQYADFFDKLLCK